MSRYDNNPFEEEDVNPFADQSKGKASGKFSFGGGGAFYMPHEVLEAGVKRGYDRNGGRRVPSTMTAGGGS
ncbi:Secretory carrier-associated membrane protein 1 [Linum perenne]